MRWLPHSVLPIGIILIYFCFVLILPSLVIICICLCKQQLLLNQTTLFPLCQTSTFAYLTTTLFLSQQQTSNSTTYCYQHVHFFNIFVTYFVYLLPTALCNYIASTIQLLQPRTYATSQLISLFSATFCQQATIQLIFSATSLSTKSFHFNSATSFSCFP